MARHERINQTDLRSVAICAHIGDTMHEITCNIHGIHIHQLPAASGSSITQLYHGGSKTFIDQRSVAKT